MWEVGPFVFCARCGPHSKENTQLLAQPCRGGVPPKTRIRLERLWAGEDPRSGQPLLPAAQGQLRPRPFGEAVLDAKFGGLVVEDGHVDMD